jgi:hypothetical protein
MVINYGLSAPVPRRSKRAICSEVWVYRFVFLTTAAACHAGAQLGFESRQKEVATTATCRSRSATAVTLNQLQDSRSKIDDPLPSIHQYFTKLTLPCPPVPSSIRSRCLVPSPDHSPLPPTSLPPLPPLTLTITPIIQQLAHLVLLPLLLRPGLLLRNRP